VTIRTRTMTIATAAAFAVSALLPTVAAVAHEVAPQDTPRTLATVRAATARYHDVSVAAAEGFVPASGCVVSPMGGMGYHYLNPDRLDATLDVAEPEVLLYERDARGRMRLIGVEYIVLDTDGDLSTPDDHTFVGEHLHGRPAGGPLPAHYLLHVWVWKHNPSGMFADWNPTVRC
jgi:hypothetical protein